jgi:hypothetical protein
MSEKGANIDLLFRNGLKDYEVLPPSGVWDGITSSGRVKKRPIIFMRIAAVITVLISIGLLTYTYTREVTEDSARTVIAFNMLSPAPIIDRGNHDFIADPTLPADIRPVLNTTEYLEPIPDAESVKTESSPDQVFHFKSNKSLSISNKEIKRDLLLSSQKSSENKPVDFYYPDLQYMPSDNMAKADPKWSIAAMASPTYYSRFNSGSDALSGELMSAEQPLVSYSGGVAFSYKLSRRFSVQSGIYYSNLGQKVEGINSFGGFKQYDNTKGNDNFEVITSSGLVSASNPDVFLNSEASERVITVFTKDVFDPQKASLQYINNSLTQSFSYLELPVTLRYKVIDKTIGINLIGGMSYNLLVHNSVYTTVNGSKYPIGDTKGMNPLSLSSTLGMGMDYNFSSKLSLNLEPMFRYYLNPFSVPTGAFVHPYSFGIFSGVTYKF